MRKVKLITTIIACAIICAATSAFAFQGLSAHEQIIYPVVRVTQGYSGGSGTVIYSKDFNGDNKHSTYVLTNYHVIADAIRIEEVWDTDLQKNVKHEKRSIVYVEIFKYRDLCVPVGTLKVEASIELYNKTEDMALIKLAMDQPVPDVARLWPHDSAIQPAVLDPTIAVGCSLGFPPLPTTGILTRMNFYIDSLPYHMSSSQIIYGNSGGAMFAIDGNEAYLIGIPSLVPIVGWGAPITHMGLFIPIDRIYKWLDEEYYSFIYDDTKSATALLKAREDRIKAKKEGKK